MGDHLLDRWPGRAVESADAPGRLGADAQALARQILTRSGFTGGVIVHLGCRDGRLTAALGADSRFTVQGLMWDAAQVDTARQQVAETVDYGRVSIDWLPGHALPYASNLVNLIVAESTGSVPIEEMLRVLAPGGVLQRKENDAWQTTVKPRPDDIDEWTHFLHDAGNNAVAQDEVVGPPRALQWVAPPLWLRSHETPSGFQSMVSSGGRVFYFFDAGPIGVTDPRFPERWSLICRDAFNGRMLWTKPLKNWGWPQWAEERFADKDWTTLRGARTIVPDENQRRLVADGDRLYVTLDYHAPLSILDATTGEVQHTVAETTPAREILAQAGIVLVHSRDPSAAAAQRRGEPGKAPSFLAAVDGTAGTVLWKQQTSPIDNLMLAVDDGLIFFRSGTELTCWDLAGGRPQWTETTRGGKGKMLLAHGGVVLVYAGNHLEARSGAVGKDALEPIRSIFLGRRKCRSIRGGWRRLARDGGGRRKPQAGRQERRCDGRWLRLEDRERTKPNCGAAAPQSGTSSSMLSQQGHRTVPDQRDGGSRVHGFGG